MAYRPQDNPLKDVKVKMENDFDAARIIYRLFHGTDEGYRKAPELSMKKRQQIEGQRNF